MKARSLAAALLAFALSAAPAAAQIGTPGAGALPAGPQTTAAPAPLGPSLPGVAGGGGITIDLGRSSPKRLTTAVEIVLFLTLLSLAPAAVLSLTSFTRIVIVLSFMKRAMSIQEMPPPLVVTGLAFFLSLFIMKPVFGRIYDEAWKPYSEEKISIGQAAERAETVMSGFLMKQTRETDLALMYEVAGKRPPASPQDVPFSLLVPAFVLSEIKTAFTMGFVLFLPFLVIDIVISSVLISMGMFTLPPIVISTPFKVLLFILVDGWNLVIHSAVKSFQL